MDIEQPAESDATRPDEDAAIDHLEDGFADPTLVGVAYQAEMTATYFLKLRDMGVPVTHAGALTSEWMCLGNSTEDDD